MNKLLPHLPLLALVFGLLIVEISQHSRNSSLLSDTLSPNSEETIMEICTKPESFSEKNESAWCNKGLAANITQHLHTWKWSCIIGEDTHSCHFTENIDYRARGGVLFKK